VDFFGCEFIDDGRYGAQRPIKVVGAFTLPMPFLWQCTDRRYLAEIAHRDRDHISELRQSIANIGLTDPLTLTFDNNGLYLQDGNHRMLAMESLPIDRAEVNVVEVPRIQRQGAQFKDIFQGEILNAISQR